jgi:hypothetical protein
LATALNARLATALNARLATALNARFHFGVRSSTVLDGRFPGPFNLRLGDGGGGIPKIAAMKNPPVEWFDQK